MLIKCAEKWLELHSSPEPLHLNSPSVEWERALIWGHPTHPVCSLPSLVSVSVLNRHQFHRLCYAREGLAPVEPKDLPEFLTPTLAFVSVLRAEISLAGPFEELLQPLLAQLEVPSPESDDRVIVPCLRLQLPCVFHHFPSAIVVKTVSGCADTQASMRTLTVRPKLNFPYHIKLSIACQITSDVRAIRPCQTVGGQLVGKQLYKFFPSDLWWFDEVASVSGSQTAQEDSQANEDKARHIGCILREDLEARANANNEALIVAGSLAQQPANDPRTHAEIVFGLESVEQKHEWLRE
jgi:siderophore synthetase component